MTRQRIGRGILAAVAVAFLFWPWQTAAFLVGIAGLGATVNAVQAERRGTSRRRRRR